MPEDLLDLPFIEQRSTTDRRQRGPALCTLHCVHPTHSPHQDGGTVCCCQCGARWRPTGPVTFGPDTHPFGSVR